jgi:hypothetical protein
MLASLLNHRDQRFLYFILKLANQLTAEGCKMLAMLSGTNNKMMLCSLQNSATRLVAFSLIYQQKNFVQILR